jgi:hypothetical protein
VFAYTFDWRSPQKRIIADTLVRQALSEKGGTTSFQVIQEFLNLTVRRGIPAWNPMRPRAIWQTPSPT